MTNTAMCMPSGVMVYVRVSVVVDRLRSAVVRSEMKDASHAARELTELEERCGWQRLNGSEGQPGEVWVRCYDREGNPIGDPLMFHHGAAYMVLAYLGFSRSRIVEVMDLCS